MGRRRRVDNNLTFNHDNWVGGTSTAEGAVSFGAAIDWASGLRRRVVSLDMRTCMPRARKGGTARATRPNPSSAATA